jgi:enoyl ACP reductase
MGLLDGKRIVVTGVLNDASIAFATARLAQEQGAEIVLTGAGRGLSLTKRTARKLPTEPPVLELDVTVQEQIEGLAPALGELGWDRVDGAVHSIGFAPEACLGQGMFVARWDDVATAMQISAYSLKSLAEAVVPMMPGGGSIVGYTFDATVAWPAYDWMGVVKAALESASRYLARDLGPQGIRVNQIAAGPIRSIAAKSIPGFKSFEDVWDGRAPLGWDVNDAEPVGRTTVALLSDWFPATTGEVIHVDGGFHATAV